MTTFEAELGWGQRDFGWVIDQFLDAATWVQHQKTEMTKSGCKSFAEWMIKVSNPVTPSLYTTQDQVSHAHSLILSHTACFSRRNLSQTGGVGDEGATLRTKEGTGPQDAVPSKGR